MKNRLPLSPDYFHITEYKSIIWESFEEITIFTIGKRDPSSVNCTQVRLSQKLLQHEHDQMQRGSHDGHRLQTVCVVWKRRVSLLPSGWNGMRISLPVISTIEPITTITKHSRNHWKAESAQVGEEKLAGAMWLRIALLWKHAMQWLPSLPKSVSCRTRAENGEHECCEMRILRWSSIGLLLMTPGVCHRVCTWP